MAQLEAKETKTFIPNETWHIDDLLDPSIESARQEMNLEDPAELLAGLKQEVKTAENGVKFAVLRGRNPDEYSEDEALVIFNPYANGPTPNMLIRSEFVRRVAKHSGVTAQDGKLKPVIMLASPSIGGSKLKLTSEEKKKVRSGDLGPAARELLHAVSTTEVGRVSLLGYSQGAETATAGAKRAYSANLDLSGLAIGDPIGIKDRSLLELGMDFSKAAPDMARVIERSGVNAQDAYKDKMSTILATFVPNALKSWSLGVGMSHNTFETNMLQLMREGRLDNITITYGSKSSLSTPAVIEPQLAELEAMDQNSILTTVRVEGATHAWDNQMPLLAKLYMRAAF